MIHYICKGVIIMFKLESKFKPTGDQPEAIEAIVGNWLW